MKDYALPHCLPSPGMLHIYHNIMKDLDTVLESAQLWMQGWKSLGPLLSKSYMRKRFIGTCLLRGPQGAFRSLFERDFPDVVTWRWGSVVQVLDKLLPAEPALRLCWDAVKFGAPDRARDHGEEGDVSLDLARVSETINCHAWWLRGHMLFALHSIGRALQQWSEGCDCHTKIVKDRLQGVAAGLDLNLGVSTCPLAGKRACQLSQGVHKVLVALGGTAAGAREQFLQACPDVDAASLEAVLSDFQLALDRFKLVLNYKTRCWQTLPWKLAQVSDPDEESARQSTKAILAEFDEDKYGEVELHPDTQAVAHRLTLLYLAPGGAVREALQKFCEGGSRADNSVLLQLCAQFVLMPTVERVIEAEHSTVAKQAVHRRVTGAYISVHLRLAEICKMLETQEDLAGLLLR